MRIYRKNEPIPFRIMLEDSSGAIVGFNTPESDNSIDQQNPSITGDPVELNEEKIINLDPSFPGLFIGIELYIIELGTGTNAKLILELQKYNGSDWQTIGESSRFLSELYSNQWNLFRDFTRYQSLVLRKETGVYRIRIHETNTETHSKLATSDGTNISYREHSASVHLTISKAYLTGLNEPDRPFYPADIQAFHPFEDDHLYLHEPSPECPSEQEKLKGIYFLNLPHGIQEDGTYMAKIVDERNKGRKLEFIKIVSGIIDGFSTLLLELSEDELTLVEETLTHTKLELFRGDSARWQFTIIDRFGSPVDLRGCSLYLTVKENEENRAEIISTEAILTNPTNGEGYFYIPYTSTEIEPGIYVFDIELSLPTGDKKTLAKGSFIVKSDVRR